MNYICYVKKILSLFLFNLLVFALFAQYNHIYDKAYPERFRLLDSLLSERIVKLPSFELKNKELLIFENTAKKFDDKEAILFGKIFRFGFERQFKYIAPKQANELCYQLIKEAENIKSKPLKAYIYNNLGHYYYYGLNQKNTSFYYYLKSYDIFKNLSNKEYHLKSISIGFLANCYYHLKDYPKAIQFGIESDKCQTNPYDNIGTLDVVGMAYLKVNKFDSAILYFNKCYKIVDSFSKLNIYVGWLGILNGNLGYCYQKKGNTEKAIELFTKAIDTTMKYNVFDNACGFAIALSNILIDKENNMYEKYISIAKSTTYNYGSKNDRYNLYELLSKYYFKKSNFNLSRLYADSQLMYKDTLFALNGYIDIMKADFEVESELRTTQEYLLKKEIAQQNIIKYSLIGFIILFVIIVLLILNKKKLHFEVAQRNSENKRIIFENDLNIAKEQLQGLKNIITEKTNLIEHLESKNKVSENSEAIAELQNITILTDDQWNIFKVAFEKVHKGYLNNLKLKISNLSPAETRLLALAKLKLSNKEMANALGVTTQAVRTSWYRLRTKLNLSNEISLEEFVENI